MWFSRKVKSNRLNFQKKSSTKKQKDAIMGNMTDP